MKFFEKKSWLIIKTSIALISVFFFTTLVARGGWFSNGGNPPNNQPPFPITVGSDLDSLGEAQIKSGKLVVNSNVSNPGKIGLLVLGSDTSGKVGVGTNVPGQAKLDVAGNVGIDNDGIIIPRNKIVLEGFSLKKITQSGTDSMTWSPQRAWMTLSGTPVDSPSCSSIRSSDRPGPCPPGFQTYVSNQCLKARDSSTGNDYVIAVSVCYK
ncbi:MAG: hypothetical protein COU07_03590 [Candidatus Harrisonbacteria bacterium CG10_big_fil_rev_8_21_14_0_10_40_38]|uniref:Uncharacterized protein n=1 Tax=Candidatus Harrisonbacteria bacterium CG10_big_fil_rev_8_21_14_0_10_40_38 TaxID=1974583 RepID=A0A2H0URC8_9BACT|nr:MAG: hypothetical protein COU07_03590 [Candidatus Harrisonbacteria bacterium CG10_big_fil_rev_8_21_14_0_10_40_38]